MAKKKRSIHKPKAQAPSQKKPRSFFQNLSEFIVKRLNFRQRIEEVKEEVARMLLQFKREVIRTLIEAILLTTGLLSLIVGVIILIERHYALEYVLIAYGLIVTIFVILGMRLRK